MRCAPKDSLEAGCRSVPFRAVGGRPRPRSAGGSRGRSNNNRRGPLTQSYDDQNGSGVAVAQRTIELPQMMTVEELATLLGVRAPMVIQSLIKSGIFATM